MATELPREATFPVMVGAAFAGVGVLLLMAGILLQSYAGPFLMALPAGVILWGIVVIVAGAFVVQGHAWAWWLAAAAVAWGLVYAFAGLARGYETGLIGLAVWGAAGYGLARADVRSHCGVVTEAPAP